MLEMKWNPSGGLIDMEQIRPRKKEKLHVLEIAGQPTNLSAWEMVVASVTQMFPMLNLNASGSGS